MIGSSIWSSGMWRKPRRNSPRSWIGRTTERRSSFASRGSLGRASSRPPRWNRAAREPGAVSSRSGSSRRSKPLFLKESSTLGTGEIPPRYQRAALVVDGQREDHEEGATSREPTGPRDLRQRGNRVGARDEGS